MQFSLSEITGIIRQRRTIYPKDHGPREVQREQLERILTNGTWAPTHGMTQPWRFKVFLGTGRQRLATFLGAEYRRVTPAERFMQRKYDNLTQRPLQSSAVIALGMARDPRGKITELDEMLAMACAVQNMHLTCTAYGLGAFWGTGAIPLGDAFRQWLGLAEGDRCLGLFYIGYPTIEWPRGYRKPLDQVVEWITTDE
jgi:nitroreductase